MLDNNFFMLIFARYYTIRDILLKDDKIVCFHDSLKPILESAFPTYVGSFNYSIETDEERLVSLQQGGKYECDGVVISQYSLSNLATRVESKTSELLTSCNRLYPLYEEVLFSQDVIVPMSQTLGELGDELVYAINTRLSIGLYSDVHDRYANLGRDCEYTALGEPVGVLCVMEGICDPFDFFVYFSRNSVVNRSNETLLRELEKT